MKLNILFQFKTGPWGGGNQFLRNLREKFLASESYEENPEKADAILFNSYHNILRVIRLKIKFPKKSFIHRLGPIFYLHRGRRWKIVDKTILKASNLISDLTIFQSEWAKEQSLKLGFRGNKNWIVIGNAVDEKLFNPSKKTERQDQKIKLVAASWSKNKKKGFDYYQFLDHNLDFTKYSLTFIGNSPLRFKNIKMIPPLSNVNLGEELRNYDIFISPISDDAFSNTIVEALSTGLPTVALKSGANAEIIGKGGELFESEKELLEKIDAVGRNQEKYIQNIRIASLREISETYLSAIKNVSKISEISSLKLRIFYYYSALIFFIFKH